MAEKFIRPILTYADEAHNVAKRGDKSSQRSKLASLLANRSDTLIMLTATPHRIYKEQLPKITSHVCRHTYCSNMAKSGMNPKTLQYLMGHADIGVTLNTYTHLGAEDAREELGKFAKMA